MILFSALTSDANAIVVLTPVVLIPIVKIVALIIGAIATPVISLSAIYYKLNKKPIIRGVLFGILTLIILAELIYFAIDIYIHKYQNLL